MLPEIPKDSVIAITSIRIDDPAVATEFAELVRGSVAQARATSGLLYLDTWVELPRYYTRSVWRSEADMQNFRNAGVHAQAIRRSRFLSPQILTTHWTGDSIPSWEEVKDKLDEEWGKQVGGF